MRATSRALQRIAMPLPLDQRRHSERRGCRLRVGIVTRHGTFHALLNDLSAGGIGFTVDRLLALRPGERLVMSHHDLGEVACVVRWSAHPRYGAEFETGSKLPAGIRAFYDTLGPAPDETA